MAAQLLRDTLIKIDIDAQRHQRAGVAAAVGFIDWLGFVVSHFRGPLPVVKPAVLGRIEPTQFVGKPYAFLYESKSNAKGRML